MDSIKPKRILVTGSRTWSDERLLRDAIHDHATDRKTGEHIAVIVHGDCSSGADKMARDYCEYLDMPQEKHSAKWDKFGKSAGYKRNAEMVATKPDLCLAFIKNNSNGTTHTISLCRKVGIPVIIHEA